MVDPSLKPDATRKGSYYRRIEDIGRALDAAGVPGLPPAPKFVVYFFASEKVVAGLIEFAPSTIERDVVGQQ
jgi:hypothetical protein